MAHSDLFKGIFWLSFIAITYLAFSPLPQPELTTSWDKLDHCLAFLLLFFACDQGWPQRWSLLHKFLLLIAYGALIELAQSFIPGRYPSWLDVVADVIGLGVYLGVKPLLVRYGARFSLQ